MSFLLILSFFVSSYLILNVNYNLLLVFLMMVESRERFDGPCDVIEVKPGSVFRCPIIHCRLTNVNLRLKTMYFKIPDFRWCLKNIPYTLCLKKKISNFHCTMIDSQDMQATSWVVASLAPTILMVGTWNSPLGGVKLP